MNPFSSLTNRIFVATALLAVLSIGVAIYIVNRAVNRQGERELQRGIEEAATLVDRYHQFSFETFSGQARLIADLPVLKAAVDTRDPATLEPLAPLLGSPGVRSSITLNAEDYLALANPLGSAGPRGQPIVIVLRSQTERQRFLTALHWSLGLTAVVALLLSILLSYGVARSVTRPIGAITSTMREMASS